MDNIYYIRAFEKFFNQSLRFLSYRPRSEKEIIEFLKKKKTEEAVIKKIIKKLKELKFINDKEFVKWWIEQRIKSKKPKGMRIIKMELQQKGINREAQDEIIGDYDMKGLSENAVKQLVTKQYPKYGKLPKIEIRRKLAQFLLRRGFEWETAKNVIDEITKK